MFSATLVLRVFLQDEELEDNHACREEPPSPDDHCDKPKHKAEPLFATLVHVICPKPRCATKPYGCDDNKRH